MTVFAVMSRKPSNELASAIARVYPGDNHKQFNDNSWLVFDVATSRSVADKLGVKRGGLTGVVILPTSGSYYGVASSDIWEWMSTQIEREAND